MHTALGLQVSNKSVRPGCWFVFWPFFSPFLLLGSLHRLPPLCNTTRVATGFFATSSVLPMWRRLQVSARGLVLYKCTFWKENTLSVSMLCCLFKGDVDNNWSRQALKVHFVFWVLLLFPHFPKSFMLFMCCNATNRCKPGFFNLQPVNPEGCQPCFCLGHSLACSSSNHFAAVDITSDFMEGIIRGPIIAAISAWLFPSSNHCYYSTTVIFLHCKKSVCFYLVSWNNSSSCLHFSSRRQKYV